MVIVASSFHNKIKCARAQCLLHGVCGLFSEQSDQLQIFLHWACLLATTNEQTILLTWPLSTKKLKERRPVQ